MKIKALTCLAVCCLTSQTQAKNLDLNLNDYKTTSVNIDGQIIKVRAYENIIYVTKPIDATYEKLNIYIPEAYFHQQNIRGYTAQTAPIFFPNDIGGYMPSQPATLSEKFGNNTNAQAIAHGYIVASAGARGRTSPLGKAPAAIVDLKAAVRYLKYNDKKMPGDANKIISNGTSAGGAMSVLLGATGDHKDYLPYLKKLGAAKTSDKIFAVSAYCPITNLDHADMAYEWQFNQIHDYKKIDIGMLDYKVQRKEIAGQLSTQQIKVSNQLAQAFPNYLNQLHLKDLDHQNLMLDPKGHGSFETYVKKYIVESAQQAINEGQDLSSFTWIKREGNKVINIDYPSYLKYLQRQKIPPAFDALDLSSGENQEFGTSTIDKQHFTEYAYTNSTVKSHLADQQVVKMMNPLNYIGHAQTSNFWRIRHGAYDKDTSLAIPIILATTLQNKGYNVNMALPWGKPHSGDYDLDELFSWIDEIATKKPN